MPKIPLRSFGALVILLSVPANAAEITPASRTLLRATFDNDQQPSADSRKALAAAVRDYCLEIDGIYPKNSPAEQQWLAGEIRGGGDRVMRAAASPEMGRSMAARFTTECALWSAALDRQPDSARNFVGLAHAFIKFMGDAEFFAPKNGIDPGRYGFGTVLRATAQSLLIGALNAPEK